MAILTKGPTRVPKRMMNASGLCEYKWGTIYCLRRKSSLAAERVKTSPEFANSRKENGFMKPASKLASRIYQSVPHDSRKYPQYRVLTGQAIKMLRSGMEEGEVLERLFNALSNI